MNPEEVRSQILKILELKRAGHQVTSLTLDLNSKLDQFFRISNIVIRSNNPQEYPDTGDDALNTSYVDYFQVLNSLGCAQEIIDLGGGVGRGALLSKLLNLPKCINLELNEKRVLACKVALNSIGGGDLVGQVDLLKETIPKADAYYLYLPLGKLFYKLLRELIGSKAMIFICESHGDVFDFVKLYSRYLCLESEIPLCMPRHNDKIVFIKDRGLNLEGNEISDFPTWFLVNFDSDKVLKARWYSPFHKQEVDLFLRITDFDLDNIENVLNLRNVKSGRVYKINSELDLYSQTFESVSYDVDQVFKTGAKLITFDGKLYRELKSGDFELLDKLTPERAFRSSK